MSLCGQKLGPRSWLQALTPAAGLGYTGSLICPLPITKPMHLDTKKVLFRDGALVMVWPGSESQGRGFPGFFPWLGWGRCSPAGCREAPANSRTHGSPSDPAGARGESCLAALTWLLWPIEPQWGEMRAGLLANEIRQASHCSWPVWLIASS